MSISFFTAVRNTLQGGYPFVEGILSALPACEQFVVSDGYSTDGTYEVLKQLADANPKIELMRANWNINVKNKADASVFAEPANEARRQCKGSHIYYLQANEVLHEKSVDKIRMLPEEHPYAELFHIPYYHFTGKNLLYSEEFRLRLAKNIKEIEATGDATHLCYSKNESMRRLVGSLANPMGFKAGLMNVVTPYAFDQRIFIHTILPKPMFRYSSLFRENYMQKLKAKIELANPADAQTMQGELDKLTRDSSISLDRYLAEKSANNVVGNSNVVSKPYYLDIKEHPKIMQPLLKSAATRYSVRPQLLMPNR